MVDVVVRDVGPRDGLQSQPVRLEPQQRVRLIRALLDAGLCAIEAGAFVSPTAVPAMAGSDAVLAGLAGDRPPGSVLSCLIPNVRGYELATAAGADSVCMVIYGSEAMARANVGMGREQADRAAAEIVERAGVDGVQVTITIAVAFECPYEGPVDPDRVRRSASRFLGLGCAEFCIADTIGSAHPLQVRELTASLTQAHGSDRIGCHFHDTRAMGLANVFAALESGVRRFDASIAGLGGCPFVPGASGNVATEDVVMMLDQMGLSTGIELGRLMRASDLARELTGTAPGGRASAWLKTLY